MARPHDWWVLDLERDPTPGDPYQVRRLASALDTLGDDAERAERDVRAVASDSSVLSWVGQAGDVFRDSIDELPGQLGKLKDSYHQCAAALSTWAADLEGAQDQADRALVDGRAAREDLNAASSSLGSAGSALGLAQNTSQRLSDAMGRPATAPPPDPEQVRSATRNLQAAQARQASAQSAVDGAQGALDAAKRMAADAAGLRDGSADRCDERVRDAADAGIEPNSWWEDVKNTLAAAWDIIIKIAKVVVLILGVVALIIGGPLAWVVFAAAMLVLADTLMKWMQGKASGWDVAFAALDCIPGVKGITSLGKIAKGLQAVKGMSMTAIASRAGTGLLRTGRMMLGEPVLALRQFLSNPGARIERMALQVRHMSPLAAMREGATAFRTTYAGGDGVWRSLQAMESAHDWRVFSDFGDAVTDISRTDPARGASLWQGGDGYYGVDRLDNVTIPAGTNVTTGTPGVGGFGVPDSTVVDLGGAGHVPAPAYNEAVQVGPNFDYGPGYRPNSVTVQAQGDVTVASGQATANPQFGGGGATQYYHPDLDNVAVGPGNASFGGAGPSVPFTDAARADVDLSGVRTVNEAVGVRRAMHAPWRIYGYVTDGTNDGSS